MHDHHDNAVLRFAARMGKFGAVDSHAPVSRLAMSRNKLLQLHNY